MKGVDDFDYARGGRSLGSRSEEKWLNKVGMFRLCRDMIVTVIHLETVS